MTKKTYNQFLGKNAERWGEKMNNSDTNVRYIGMLIAWLGLAGDGIGVDLVCISKCIQEKYSESPTYFSYQNQRIISYSKS